MTIRDEIVSPGSLVLGTKGVALALVEFSLHITPSRAIKLDSPTSASSAVLFMF